MSERRLKNPLDDSSMSDRTLLVNVEDLIYGTFGTLDENRINFQVLYSVLIILARQLRMLQQEVEIGFDGLVADNKRDTLRQAATDVVTPTRTRDMVSSTEAARKDAAGRSQTTGRVGGIDGVSVSQFALLEEAVKKLAKAAGPLPAPSMPNNVQLRKDLAHGRASLSETMSAMQLKPRVEAAEQGLYRLAALLTQLTAVGILPSGVANNVKKMRADLIRSARKLMAEESEHGENTVQHTAEWLSDTQEPSELTREEMEDHVQYAKDEIIKAIEKQSTLASDAANKAFDKMKTASNKMEIIQKTDRRITDLSSQTRDYVLQFNGFDYGLSTQMVSFREQMALIKCDLIVGIKLFDTVNNSTETLALIDLNERYHTVAEDLETTVAHHKALDIRQTELCIELKNLIECLEMLREEKVDRDEVIDGLRDKANLADVVEMLQETDFANARLALEQRLAKSYDQFNKLDSTWQNVLKELMVPVQRKAEHEDFISLQNFTKERLVKFYEDMHKLEIMLGEPKAAFLVRKIKMDGADGLMPIARTMNEPEDRTDRVPSPLRHPPAKPCLTDVASSLTTSDREHTCHRWVGGSHTLLPSTMAREKASLIKLQLVPTKKFTGYGNDGRLYLMEEELQACAECNSEYHAENISPQVATPTGGGRDQTCH